MFDASAQIHGGIRKRFGALVCIAIVSLGVGSKEMTAMVPFMDGGIFLNVSGRATYDTSIFANASEEEDFYITAIPELQYRREAGVLHLEFRGGVEVIRFVDFTEQDAEDFFSFLALTYPNRPDENPRRVSLDTGWRQRSSANETIGDRTRSEIFSVEVTGRSRVSDRLDLRGAGGYSNEQFRRGSFSEIDLWMASADTVYMYSENFETFAGYRYRHTRTEGRARPSLSIDDHLIQGGVEGRLGRRTLGAVSIGVQGRVFRDDDIGNLVRPYGAASVNWTPRTRSEFTFEAAKDFSVAPDDRSVDSTVLRLGLDQGVYRGLSLEPTISYSNVRIVRSNDQTRNDDRYEGGLGIVYQLANGAITEFRYSYIKRNSNEARVDYERHVADLSARFTF